MADKKAVTLEHLEIVKNYINNNDAENIKSAEFVDDTLKFYTTEDKSGEAIAEFTLPEETFLDGSKTEIVSDFSWSKTKYPKSTDPELDGKAVLVLAVKAGKTVRYSFASLDSVITRLTGGETESANVSVADDAVSLNVKISELSDNRVIIKDDGLYVGTVDNTPTWTVSTDEEVGELFSVGSSPSFGANTLGARNVGDIVKIKENGELVNYIVVQKGLPSEMYDESCDGVWLLRDQAHIQMIWDNEENDYENSDIHIWLNREFLTYIDSKIFNAIKEVKIPYYKGTSIERYGVQSGKNGLNCKIFLLSPRELRKDFSDSRIPFDGTGLDYFTKVNSSLICKKDDGKNAAWWLRSLNLYYTDKKTMVYSVDASSNPSFSAGNATSSHYVRPAFILPYDIAVDSDGLVTA